MNKKMLAIAVILLAVMVGVVYAQSEIMPNIGIYMTTTPGANVIRITSIKNVWSIRKIEYLDPTTGDVVYSGTGRWSDGEFQVTVNGLGMGIWTIISAKRFIDDGGNTWRYARKSFESEIL